MEDDPTYAFQDSSMTRTTFLPALAVLLAPLLTGGCGLFGGGSDAPAVNGCPEDAEQVSRLAWEMEKPTASKVRAGLLASLELNNFATVLDDELTQACTALAKQLFAKDKQLEPETYAVGAEAQKACVVVSESLDKLKGIAGGTIEITAKPVLCSTRMDAASECLGACKEKGKQPKASCGGELSGSCKGSCNGQCTVDDADDCAGTCAGACKGGCDSEFTGTCRGECEGTCDGTESKGQCEGVCQGRCLKGALGTCGGTCMGQCEGSCTIEAAGECSGVCAGECDKPFKETRCTGPISLDGKLSSCEESCRLALMSAQTCTPPGVQVKVVDATNEEAAGLIERSLSQHLPKILAALALNVEVEPVDNALAHATKAIEKMQKASKKKDVELTKKAKACIKEQVEQRGETSSGVLSLLQSGDTARLATQGSN